MTRVEEQAEAAAATTEGWEWLTTAPNPRAPIKGYDAGQRGWRLHAVRSDIPPSAGVFSACGLLPRHGWALDLFIEEKCERCLRALDRLVLKSSIHPEEGGQLGFSQDSRK